VTTALVLKRDYLVSHRRMILGRAVAGTLAGLVPVPFLDDFLVSAVVGSGYRKIAASHQVDIDKDAVSSLVFGKAAPTSFAEMAGTAIVYRLAAKTMKRMLVALTALRRAKSAANSFLAMTLFDHYCARLHVGLGLSREEALELREAISEAIAETPGGLSLDPFRRGAIAAARATLKAPLELADLLSAGALRRYLDRQADVTEADAVTEIDEALDKQLAEHSSFLARTVTAVELQLSAEVNPYLDALILRFDDIWKRRTGKDTP
jgi:hypothetical protein